MSILLRRTRLRVEKMIYEKGTNVALYHAERSKRYQNFQSKLEKELYKQIKYAVSDDNIDILVVLAKAKSVPQELLAQVSAIIKKVTLEGVVAFAEYLMWAGEQGGQAAVDKAGIDGVFGLVNEDFVAYFDDYSKLLIKSLDDFTMEWLAGKIQQGKSEGLTNFEIQEQIRKEGKGFSAIRAERIVLTETAKAMVTVEMEAYKRWGIVDIVWKTSLDERVCPICGDLNNKEAKIGGTFPGGYESPPAHVSCRCYIDQIIPKGWELPEDPWLGQ